jgi:hypothetical protein
MARFAAPLLLVLLALAFGGAEDGAPPSAFASDHQPGLDERSLVERDWRHWAFRPLERRPPPAPRGAAAAESPIDLFIFERLEARGLEAMPSAGRAALLRRLRFDLTGLPPEPEEVDAFLGDASPDASERLVDRLLASPAYGERWGQHWLDLARFAESDGFEHDSARPEAWRYRDWTIAALNADLPYDEFVRLQIAGDLLRPGDLDAAIATGFALSGPDMPDLNLQEERRHVVLNEMAATVGSVFLGLQFGCAQCHDHKSDPLSQADFYRLRAFFDNLDVFRDAPPPGAEAGAQAAAAAGAEPKEPAAPRLRVLREKAAPLGPSFLWVRGDFRQRGPQLEPAFPRIANPWRDRPEVFLDGAGAPATRTALARWLTRPDHALALRVIANRLWQHHFGEGLARTPGDFGLLGEAPSHPELLDWLAAELPRRGWSLKSLHRLIVGSAAYRRASRSPPGSPGAAAAGSGADPENRLLWRRDRRRLEAEAIRDALLAASGTLSPRSGGPGVMAPLPEEIRKSIRKDHWKVSPDPEDHRRRSIYLFARRNLRYPFLEVFDRPDPNLSCARRDRTTIAPQSLALLNSDLAVEAAAALARRARGERAAAGEASIVSAYRLALGRAPEPAEIAAAREFLGGLAARLKAEGRGDPEAGAFEAFSLALFNLNEFVYVD